MTALPKYLAAAHPRYSLQLADDSADPRGVLALHENTHRPVSCGACYDDALAIGLAIHDRRDFQAMGFDVHGRTFRLEAA